MPLRDSSLGVPDNRSRACGHGPSGSSRKAPRSMSSRGLAAEAPAHRPISRGPAISADPRRTYCVSAASAMSFSPPRRSPFGRPRQHSGSSGSFPKGSSPSSGLPFLRRPAPCGAVGKFYPRSAGGSKGFSQSFQGNPDPRSPRRISRPTRHNCAAKWSADDTQMAGMSSLAGARTGRLGRLTG